MASKQLMLLIGLCAYSIGLNADYIYPSGTFDFGGTYYPRNHLNDYGLPAATGYGSGGYGDPTRAAFNLNVCASRSVDAGNCTEDYPEEGMQWRFVRDIGWRKFAQYGAARKDYWDFKRTLGWPFGKIPFDIR